MQKCISCWKYYDHMKLKHYRIHFKEYTFHYRIQFKETTTEYIFLISLLTYRLTGQVILSSIALRDSRWRLVISFYMAFSYPICNFWYSSILRAPIYFVLGLIFRFMGYPFPLSFASLSGYLVCGDSIWIFTVYKDCRFVW